MLFLLFATVALAQNDCYTAANKRAGSIIVPCSSGSGFASCCQSGDLCLADSACWNPTYNVTYLYGCTDPSYSDASCPWKCGDSYADAPYVGLDYCYNTTRFEWSCTHPPNDNPAVGAFSAQECVDDSIIAFAGPSSLQPILSLPTDVGGSTLYFSEVNPTLYTPVSGYTPATTPTPTASKPSSVELVSSTATTDSTSTGTHTGTKTGTHTGTATSAAASNQTSDSSSSGLSTGAKAGIGAGIGGAAIAIAAIVIAWMVMRRRKSAPSEKNSDILPVAYTAIPDKKRPIQDGPSELPPNERKPSPGPSELPESESHYGTPAPTYTSWTRPTPGQQVYEMPADSSR